MSTAHKIGETRRIPHFSFARAVAVLRKEFIQMRRDRLTFGMIVGIPIVQLVLFGYAINSDPKNLPTALVVADPSVYSRSVVAAIENSGYFRIAQRSTEESSAERALQRGDVQFAIIVPPDFARRIERGIARGSTSGGGQRGASERASLIVIADASDPAATSNALTALGVIQTRALRHDLTGANAELNPADPPFDLIVHRRYNPEGITQYNIVPGLLGVILQMTMVMMTAFAMTRERERGTMENLLATPIRPVEVMLGKIVPYVIVGFIQVTIILLAAKLLFAVPMIGSLTLLLFALVIYIAALLALGFSFSTMAQNQLQAMQMTFFFFLPSLLMSGFMFPFRGMPQWAQAVGQIFPLTHFLRIVRGILLKGSTFAEIWPEVWPIVAFLAVASTVALLRYRQTLD